MFKTGYIRDPHGLRAYARAARPLGSSNLPSAFSLEADEWTILDQNGTSGCTGYGTAQALYISYAAAGKKLPFCPSPKLLYALARILARTSANDPLFDLGASPTQLIIAVNRWGITAMDPTTPNGAAGDLYVGNVNDEPSMLDLETAGMALQVLPGRIDETATDFTSQICTSLCANVSSCVGIFVDSNFMAYDGSSPVSSINTSDPKGGGHWVPVSYYYIDPSGTLILGGPNSWGPLYGKSGHWEATASCIQSVCTDCLTFPA
jgi:hypothetical protein